MNWVKTFFTIKAKKETIKTLKQILFVEDTFTVHKLYRIPKRLIIRSNELVSEIILLFNYLETNGYDVMDFTIRDFYRPDIVDFLNTNRLDNLLSQLDRDIKSKILPLEMKFTEYLETYRRDVSQLVIKHIRNYRETGYYNAADYYLDKIGSGCHPVHVEIAMTDTEIKGSFLTTWTYPILFFNDLKETYPVQISLAIIDLDTEEYISLDD